MKIEDQILELEARFQKELKDLKDSLANEKAAPFEVGKWYLADCGINGNYLIKYKSTWLSTSGDQVNIGCQTFSRKDISNLHLAMGQVKADAIEVKGSRVTRSEIEKLLNGFKK